MTNDAAIRFEADTQDWRTRLQSDEWFFANLREEFVDSFSPPEAFDNIGAVSELVLNQDDNTLCSEAALLLCDLARRSGTSQLDPVLDRN